MSQLTKIILFLTFLLFCLAISDEFSTLAFYGGIALFLLWGLVVSIRANKREKDVYKKNAPDPDSIRRYYRTGYTCAEEFATFEEYVEGGLEKRMEPPARKEGIKGEKEPGGPKSFQVLR